MEDDTDADSPNYPTVIYLLHIGLAAIRGAVRSFLLFF